MRIMHVSKAAFAFACLLLFPLSLHAQRVTRHVDPFIGTSNGGNTFPGAVLPWGMVSVSPHNALGAPSGYIFGGKEFTGFGHVHLSGTGCADLGSVILNAARWPLGALPGGSKCSLKSESASPGYYRAELVEPGLVAEATVTERCGLTRFTAEAESDLALMITAGESLALKGGGSVVILSDSEAEGWNVSGGLCGEENRQTVYFVARFNRPSLSSGTWKGVTCSGDKRASATDTALGGWFHYKLRAGEALSCVVGISYVGCANARLNLDAEVPACNFERTKASADSAWESELSRIQVKGGSEVDLTKFYTALYHMLIHPGIISDVNGEYPLMGRRGIGKHPGRERYSVFSLWDTYRTLHPFLTLVYPERQSAIVSTMIDMYRESGWLPKWEIAGNETFLMSGDPAPIVIADSYLKGIHDFDVRTAFEAMKKPAAATTDTSAPPIRAGYHEYLRYGYIPYEQDTTRPWWVWGPASTTLEYCMADWSIARLASALGDKPAAKEFQRRSMFYRNLIDTTSRFIRPKRRDGSWLSPFDPVLTEGSGSWAGSGGPGYVEGNAWQYTWFVPHDLGGLAKLLGGAEACLDKLDQCFLQNRFTINNEPDIAYPYLFGAFRGHEGRTRELVRGIMENDFRSGPGGLPGNDDAGAISGWFVFSALGFYPACPASNKYALGIPLFDTVTVRLNRTYYPGSALAIERVHGNQSSKRVPPVNFNGFPLPHYEVAHGDLVRGGRLVFTLPPEL
jgi:predicted alpha-1,2-mannosidase